MANEYGGLLSTLNSIGSRMAQAIREQATEQSERTTSSLMAQKNVQDSIDKIKDTKGFSEANMALFRTFADFDKAEKKFNIIESPEKMEGYRGTVNDTQIFGVENDPEIMTFQQLADAHEGMGSYDTLYNNTGKIKSSPFYGVDITNKTLGDMLQFTGADSEYLKYNIATHGQDTTAVGRYQFVGKTLRDIVERGKFDLNRKFDSSLQDELFKWYMDDTLKVNNRTGITIEDKIDAVISRWEGFKNAPRETIRMAIEEYELGKIASNPPMKSLLSRRGS